MKIFKELKKLGYIHYSATTIEELDDLPLNSAERVSEQALVLRWFRKKHNIYGIILPSYADSKIIKDRFFYEVAHSKNLKQELEYHPTHEEAELECIKKLIKMCQDCFDYNQYQALQDMGGV